MNTGHKRPPGSVEFNNKDRVMLVSGGGQGIGRATAKAWAESGGIAIVMEKDLKLRAKVAGWGQFYHGDVTSPESCRDIVMSVTKSYGGIDVVVPNAVIEGPESYLDPHLISPSLWEEYMAVNLTGVQNILREVIPVMLNQGSGYAVLVCSVQGMVGARQSAVYAASKAAMLNMTGTYATSYARHNIRVNGVLPGAVMTEGMVPKLAGQGGSTELANRHPRGVIGLPEEIARVILALASPIADNVIGSQWRCDGGLMVFPAFDNPFSIENLPEQPLAEWQQEQSH